MYGAAYSRLALTSTGDAQATHTTSLHMIDDLNV